MIVSHDKMFLDNVTNRTIEIVLGKIYDYPRAYTKYLVLREEQKTLQLASQKNQQKQIEQTEKLIEKFRAKASKATMAQSLIKKLDKIERIAVDEDDNSVMTLKFPVSTTPGKVVVEATQISKEYGDLQVLQHIDLMVDCFQRRIRIVFVLRSWLKEVAPEQWYFVVKMNSGLKATRTVSRFALQKIINFDG